MARKIIIKSSPSLSPRTIPLFSSFSVPRPRRMTPKPSSLQDDSQASSCPDFFLHGDQSINPQHFYFHYYYSNGFRKSHCFYDHSSSLRWAQSSKLFIDIVAFAWLSSLPLFYRWCFLNSS